MTILKKRAPSDNKGINGLYVHSNPPRVLSVSASHIRQLIRNGDIDKLEQLVYEGQGKKLIGEYSADYKTRMFLKSVPSLMSKISLLHDALNSDRLGEIQSILDEEPEKKKKLVMAKDDSGVGLLHKAVYYDLKSIYRWLIDKFPHTVHMRDSEGRTPYFYTLMCKDPVVVQKLLTVAGADPNLQDYSNHTTKYYQCHLQELELPSCQKSTTISRKGTGYKDSLSYKKSNIRIWIHQRNMTNLQQLIWDGHGSKLLVEHSNNPKMRKFLEAVPYIMGLIKDVHCDAQNGDLDSLINRVSPPVPPAVLTAKDANGLTPLHKAVGLGKSEIAHYIIEKIPECINAVDNEGRTPLHYTACLKDDQKMFNYLIEHGADESALDNRQKTAAYYKTRASELDSTKVLNQIPECPRGAKEPNSFDWSLLTLGDAATSVNGFVKKAKDKNENGVKDKLVMQESAKNNEEDMQITSKKKNTCKDDNKTSHQEDNKTNKDVSFHNSTKTETMNNNKRQEPVAESERSIEETKPEESEENDDQVDPETNNEELITNEDKENNLETKTDHENNNEENNEQEVELEDPKPEEDQPNEKSDATSAVEGTLESPSKEEVIETKEDNVHAMSTEAETISDKNEDTEESEGAKSRISTGKSSRPQSQITSNNKEAEEEEEEEKEEEEEEHENETEGEGVIEGVVNGENEIETMNKDGQNRPSSQDEDVKALIESANMEELAALVLNGDGDKLVNEKSDNQELQTFLDNVPVYMSKIRKIHTAAREGSLRDLQAALDRRKFAVAKDKISPNGASPLHVAVAFGRTSIVRYLAGRFPETVMAEDDNGRTPLHYAAVLKDNGHYYNLLTHLGADSRKKDKFDKTPTYYTKIQTDFNQQKILGEFGAEGEVANMVNNKDLNDDLWSARKPFDDEEMIAVLEKCYSVLYGRRNSSMSSSSSLHSITAPYKVNNSASAILSKQLKRNIFDMVKIKLTRLDHNFYDIIWPTVKKLPTEPNIKLSLEEDFPLGIVAPDVYVYKVFSDILDPIIKEYNYLDINRPFALQPSTEFFRNNNEVELDLDPHGHFIITEPMVKLDENDENQTDMPFFATEEGRYLASSLGDPLIKGLTEVANKRPEDPIAYLATYLYNFAQNSRDGPKSRGNAQERQHEKMIMGGPQTGNENGSVPASIEVVTVDPDETDSENESAFKTTTRDEHGQSMLHFAAARSHGRNSLFQLLLESEINIGFRDELYRTARDISIQANVPENTIEIDRYVLHIATNGDTSKLVELLLEGYDHITDVVDGDAPIVDIVAKANQPETVSFLQSILAFEEKRERVHHAIRQGFISEVMSLMADEKDTGSGKLLAIGKNTYGRCSLHVAVLCQQEEIVDYLANTFTDTLKIGDNLERTALHYAMGIERMESITRVLIKAGAKRVVKDLKGRQPTYYFLNKSDILRLQEEEETI